MFQPSEVVAVVLKKLAGKPFVIWVQRMVFGKGITRWMQIWVLKNCDHVFFNSTFTRGEALKECKPKSFSILHMGVDLARFRPMDKGEIRKKLGLPENAKVVFAVGRFVEKKGFEYLIGAMRLLKTKGVVCAIGGFGPLEGEFKEAAEKAGLAGSVIFPGKLSNKEDVPFWINAADIFVVPSIVDSNGETETLGIVAIEGIACGRPVIASAVGGLVDVVKDGFNGFLVKQKSAEQIAGKIDLLFGKKGLIEKLGKNARAYAEENFSERQAVEKTMRVYEKILGE
jgi:glycosyltransferase involved in cell wall biosynthesis